MTAAIKILFVDDEQLILHALRRTLRREPFEVLFTDEPASAGRLIAEHGVDIVVCDYMMPGMSGVEVLAAIARSFPHTIRIMMTGQADSQATIRAINEGSIHRFLEKPWADDHLKRVLREVAVKILVERGVIDARQAHRGHAQHQPEHPHAAAVERDGSGAILIDEDFLERD